MKELAKNILHKKYMIFALIGLVLLVILGSFTAYGCVIISGDRVIDGVSISGTQMSGKTKQEVEAFLSKTLIPNEDEKIHFECEDVKFYVTPSQIGLYPDIHQTADKIYNVGRNGNIVSKIIEGYISKFKHIQITPVFYLDDTKLNEAIANNINHKLIPPTEFSVVVNEDSLTVTNGTAGKGLKGINIADIIKNDIAIGKSDNIIKLHITDIWPKEINADEFIKEYLRKPKNAKYSENNGQYIFTPEVSGIEFDENIARKIIEENKDSKEPYTIPATVTAPEITVKDLQSKFAVDTLASYCSNYASSDANRANNVELAASKINGYILNPGERFSFNKVVGPRTSAHGFKVAQVYEGDRIVDGMGGGICQVSSTLYNAVVLADLKIVSRTNHSMPVSYMPIGRDATVSYGTIDFVFENNKNYPVTLFATSINRVLTVAVKGVDESEGVTVDITTEYVGSTAFETVKVEDATLKAGESKIVKNGANGSIVNSYKVYKKDGRTIKSEYLAKSVYIPVSQVVHIGIEKEEEQQEETPLQSEQQPTDTPEQIIADENTKAEDDVPASSNPEEETQTQPEISDNIENEAIQTEQDITPSVPEEDKPPVYI